MIVSALPIPLIEKLVKSKNELEDNHDDDEDSGMLNFRDLLKAKTLHLPMPKQIVWPDRWDAAAKIPHKVKRDGNRQTQAKAIRAWDRLNDCKAGNSPGRYATWGLPPWP